MSTVPKNELLVVLPFLGTFSLNLRKRLYKSVSKSLPQCNIKVIFQSKNRLSSLFKFKGSIPLYLHSHPIYKFQCSNCNITYLRTRDDEHISKSSLTGKRVNSNKSSVKDHCLIPSNLWIAKSRGFVINPVCSGVGTLFGKILNFRLSESLEMPSPGLFALPNYS